MTLRTYLSPCQWYQISGRDSRRMGRVRGRNEGKTVTASQIAGICPKTCPCFCPYDFDGSSLRCSLNACSTMLHTHCWQTSERIVCWVTDRQQNSPALAHARCVHGLRPRSCRHAGFLPGVCGYGEVTWCSW